MPRVGSASKGTGPCGQLRDTRVCVSPHVAGVGSTGRVARGQAGTSPALSQRGGGVGGFCRRRCVPPPSLRPDACCGGVGRRGPSAGSRHLGFVLCSCDGPGSSSLSTSCSAWQIGNAQSCGAVSLSPQWKRQASGLAKLCLMKYFTTALSQENKEEEILYD